MFTRRTLLSIFIWIVSLTGIILVASFYSSYDLSGLPNDYSIVFDSGSSGSRMYIYQWTAGYSAAKGDPLRIVQNLSCNTNDGGLNQIKNRQDLEKKFSTCISKAKDIIPVKRQSRAYIFLAATAGMRLLDSQNKTASDQIFNYVRDYFSSLGFLYKNSSQVRLLSGSEEGINAFISANYFENNFAIMKHRKKTKGILDLGGASTQISYVPSDDNNNRDPQYYTKIRIYGLTYSVYSHSFLCWGINEISLLYKTLLINEQHYPQSNLIDGASCYPQGSQIQLDVQQIVGSPCANGRIFNYTYNFTADLNRLVTSRNLTFKGSSNEQQCKEQVQMLLPRDKCPYGVNKCSFDGALQPTLNQSDFLGFSNYFYALANTAKLYQLKLPQIGMEDFRNLTSLICNLNFQQLKDLNANSSSGLSDSFLINQCFANTFMLEILSAYGFTSFENLRMTDKVAGFSLNWALGYMINELNRDDFLPFEAPPRKLKLPWFVLLTIVFSLAFLAAVFYVLHPKIKKKFNSMKNTEEIPFSQKRNDQTDTNMAAANDDRN